MSKKKFDLTAELVDIDDSVEVIQEEKINNKKTDKTKVILLTMSIEEELRAEYKAWCANHRLKMNEAFVKGFKLLKEKYNT